MPLGGRKDQTGSTTVKQVRQHSGVLRKNHTLVTQVGYEDGNDW